MMNNQLAVRDHMIDVPNGSVFVREWAPEAATGAAQILG
jgi:hypothetical protein